MSPSAFCPATIPCSARANVGCQALPSDCERVISFADSKKKGDQEPSSDRLYVYRQDFTSARFLLPGRSFPVDVSRFSALSFEKDQRGCSRTRSWRTSRKEPRHFMNLYRSFGELAARINESPQLRMFPHERCPVTFLRGCERTVGRVEKKMKKETHPCNAISRIFVTHAAGNSCRTRLLESDQFFFPPPLFSSTGL